MGKDDIKTVADLSRIIADIESNVIPTGVGSLPNQVMNSQVENFLQTARVAAGTTNTNPLARLDTDLYNADNQRLVRLSSALAKAATAARFAAKPPTPMAEAPRHTPTTITTETGTIIRPVEAQR